MVWTSGRLGPIEPARTKFHAKSLQARQAPNLMQLRVETAGNKVDPEVSGEARDQASITHRNPVLPVELSGVLAVRAATL